MKHALVISYHFSPDPSVGAKRPTELVGFMVEKGWHVTVLTKKYGHETGDTEAENSDAVNIIRAPHWPGILNPCYLAFKRLLRVIGGGRISSYGNTGEADSGVTTKAAKENPISLKYRMKRFVISGQAFLNATKGWLIPAAYLLLMLKAKGRRYNVIISSSPPASAHLLSWMAKTLFKGKLILDLRDPINMWDLVMPVCSAPYRISIEDWLANRYLNAADLVVTTTDRLRGEMEELATRANYKFKTGLVYNGFDGDIVREGAPLDGVFELAFAGELYANRNPFPLFIAIRDLLRSGEIGEGGIRFHLYGNCGTWNGHDVNLWVQQNQLQDVILLHGLIAREALEKELLGVHLLVSYAQKQPLQIPAKTFDHIRYPCKSLVITEKDSSTGIFVMSNDLGYSSGDSGPELKKTLLTALDDYKSYGGKLLSISDLNRRRAFSRERQNKNYLKYIESVCD